MRPSRTALSIAALAAATGTAVVVLAGGSSATVAAPSPSAQLSAPVASAPKVVAHAVSAPKATKPVVKAAAKPVTKPAAKPVVKAVAKPAAPVATKPAAQPVAKPVAKPASKPTTTTTTTTSSAPRTGNDYPYASATGGTDEWGFTKRQCVSFAAWRLSRDGRAISNTAGWGSAYHWDETAAAQGVRVSTTPHVGAIAQWNAGEASKVWMNGGQGTFSAGSYGHVGYVAAVYSDGSALIEQYNAMGDRSYSTLRMTAPRYLF